MARIDLINGTLSELDPFGFDDPNLIRYDIDAMRWCLVGDLSLTVPIKLIRGYFTNWALVRRRQL